MKPEKVFKRYDIRGRYPEELNEEFAERLGMSLGEFAKTDNRFKPVIVVCRDNKDTSGPLKEYLINGVTSTGVKVVDLGVGPTDYAAYGGKELDAISVQVTSSHMPLDFNGFKFMYPEGNGFINKDLNKVKDLFRENRFDEGSGEVDEQDFLVSYIDDLEGFAENLGLDWSGKEVVVDCLGGSTLPVVPRVLESLGAEVHVIDFEEESQSLDNYKPYKNPPNPTEEQLSVLKRVVDEQGADLGLSFDLDGDRVTLYHRDGFVSGDEVFSIFAKILDGDVVGSIDTSGRVKEVASSRDSELFLTRVGDPFVMDEAVERDVELAGEPNGHYSFLDFVPYNSGSLAGIILAGLDLEQIREALPSRSIYRDSIEVEDKKEAMEKVKSFVKSEADLLSSLDGFKFIYRDVSVLVRPSGSSPKLRFVLDGEGDMVLESVFEDIRDKIF